jgi:molybdenum cofactor cytidylyltransferase
MRDVAAVILAAGGSQRMGRAKQLLRVGGRSLVKRAVAAAVAAGCSPVVVVVGARAEEVERELLGSGAAVVRNEGWERGIGSSIRAGVEYLLKDVSPIGRDESGAATGRGTTRLCPGLVIMLCDQPLVGAEVLGRLLDAHARGARLVTAAEFDGTLGPPVVVDVSLFAELLALPDDRGAKALWMARPEIVGRVACPEAGVDVDTAGDFERLICEERSGADI